MSPKCLLLFAGNMWQFLWPWYPPAMSAVFWTWAILISVYLHLIVILTCDCITKFNGTALYCLLAWVHCWGVCSFYELRSCWILNILSIFIDYPIHALWWEVFSPFWYLPFPSVLKYYISQSSSFKFQWRRMVIFSFMGYVFRFLSKMWSADPGVQRFPVFFQRLAVLCFTLHQLLILRQFLWKVCYVCLIYLQVGFCCFRATSRKRLYDCIKYMPFLCIAYTASFLEVKRF